MWLNKLEKKYGKYAIPNLTYVIIGCYIIGYLIQFFAPNFFFYLSINPYAIIRGQVWRLFTWLLLPPGAFSLFTVISLFFYFYIGTSLERAWGTFRYNMFLLSGILFTVVGAFTLLLIPNEVLQYASNVGVYSLELAYQISSSAFSTYYVSLSLFLMYAITFPDNQVYLMMIIPVKLKHMGIIYGIYLAGSTLVLIGKGNWAGVIVIVFSLMNVIIFFIVTRKSFKTPVQMKRQKEFKKKMRPQGRTVNGQVTKHKCAICGKTEQSGDDIEFRFCSKCDGNYEYCSEHLFTHTHIKKG